MGDEEHAESRPFAAHGLHAVGHDAQRVDVEARVGLVEHGQLRVEHGHLQDLVALLLAAGEALVQVALTEGGVHARAASSTRASTCRTSSTERSSPTRADTAWRRNWITGTPGISSGY